VQDIYLGPSLYLQWQTNRKGCG